MAQRGSYGLSPQLDIQQLQAEAQHRWLRPAEICEILRNYQKFQLTPEPPTRPPSGSLFLFDKKALRYFRKDGHNWRKKKDGKTVKEAHEKLKVGSIDVLHCYYARSEENENFQRRSYWMLETELMHIVFVHYLEIKGNRTSVTGIRENDEASASFQRDSLSYSYSASHCTTPSGNADSTSPTSTLTALCEDADSASVGVGADESSGFHALLGIGSARGSMESLPPNTYLPDNYEARSSWPQANIVSNTNLDRLSDAPHSSGLESWEEILKQAMSGSSTVSFRQPTHTAQSASSRDVLEQDNGILGELLGGSATTQPHGSHPPAQLNWQVTLEDNTLRIPGWPIDEAVDLDLAYSTDARLLEQIKKDPGTRAAEYQESYYGAQNNLSGQYQAHPFQNRSADVEHQFMVNSNSENDAQVEGEINHAFTARRLLSDGDESLKKVDSFNRWITKELGDVEDLQMQSTPSITWSTVECENVVDESSLSPSISQDQLFSIDDFSPKWAYPDSEIEVIIVGRFLNNQKEIAACNWSCMFGELEVPTRVLAEGILSCCAPFHDIGRVPFYVTCSNRLACSEVREFDYHAGSAKVVNARDIYDADTTELHLHLQLERLLSFSFVKNFSLSSEGLTEKRKLIDKIIALKDEEQTFPVVDVTSEDNFMYRGTKEELLQKATKEKLFAWLLHKLTEDGKGPCILDDQGQGILHLTAALGYDWAMKPILAAGISVNFRDVNGWTALHWAACCGREQTVAVLVFLGADTGLVSDPSPDFPLGRSPADLASANGHKGISGFLAESTLTSYVSSLSMNDAKEDSVSEVMGTKAFHTISERSATPFTDGDVPDVLSLKDSLTAVCNATHAASKIYQMFRIQSFQRKQLEHENHKSGLLDEQAIALAAGKPRRVGLSDGRAHTAAIHIQKKFRGWKKRKDFLIIRQRIVKIQAHVRGHQVRKQYGSIIWSVGILEKVILRWRRKGSGLRGYRADASKDLSQQALSHKEDDYDFLKEGRKQTEERLQKALTRVKSMAQYPEARAQYRRLLTVVEGIRENKTRQMVMSNSQEAADGDEDLIEIESLLDNDTFMSMTFD